MDPSKANYRRYSTVTPWQALAPFAGALWVFGFIWHWTDGLSNILPDMRYKVLGSAAIALIFLSAAISRALRVDDVIFLTDARRYRRRQGWWRNVRVWEGDTSGVRIRQTAHWSKPGADFDESLVFVIVFEFSGIGQPPLRIQPDRRDRRLARDPGDPAEVSEAAVKRIHEEIGKSIPRSGVAEGVTVLPPDPIPKSPSVLAIQRGASPGERIGMALIGLFFAALSIGMIAFAWIELLIPYISRNTGSVRGSVILGGVLATLMCVVIAAVGLLLIYLAFTLTSGSASSRRGGSPANRPETGPRAGAG